MADISSITLPGGGTYDLKDKNAVPKYGMGKNLIDNWYFVGGGTGPGVFPVNQRNATSAVSGYFIDRWRSGLVTGFSLSLSATGLVLTNSGTQAVALPQDLSNAAELLGKRVTYSILTANGLYKNTGVLPSTFNNSGGQISVSDGTNVIGQLYVTSSIIQARLRSPANSGTITFVAVKLELGREQTLAHQESSTWILNEIPDYEEELLKCQTSTASSSDSYANKSLATEQQLAYVETGTTASRAYAVGEYFCLNGLLYRVTAAISSGGTFTPGTNCEQKYATGMAVQWKDVSGTSGGSSAVDVTTLTGLRPSNALILSVFDKDATVNGALSLVFYPSGDRYGASLVNKAGANQASTAFNLRIMYASI